MIFFYIQTFSKNTEFNHLISKVHTTMTCLKDRVLGGAGMKSHSFMLVLGIFFVQIYLGEYANFQEIFLQRYLGKSSKLFIVVTLLQ